MFLLTRKGSVLIFLGIGILLGFLGESDALKCYACEGKEPCKEKDCGTPPPTTGPETKPMCFSHKKKDGAVQKDCTTTQFYNPNQCFTDETGTVCTCLTNLCNDDSLFNQKSSSPRGPSSTGVIYVVAILVAVLQVADVSSRAS